MGKNGIKSRKKQKKGKKISMRKREAFKTSREKGKKELSGYGEMQEVSTAVAMDFVMEFFHIIGKA